MLCKAMANVTLDKVKAFKSLFLTNALDGSEDHLVSDRIFRLIGEDIKKLMADILIPTQNIFFVQYLVCDLHH